MNTYVVQSNYPGPENFTYFNLTILDSWTLNPGFPEFVGELPEFVVQANTTKSFKLPLILDQNGDSTWHTCNIDLLNKFAVYTNKTRTLEVFPDDRTMGEFQFRCQLYDINRIVRNMNYTLFVKVMPIPEPAVNFTEEAKKNKTIPPKVEKWYPIEPVISRISIFGKVDITFSIPLKAIKNLTLIDDSVF